MPQSRSRAQQRSLRSGWPTRDFVIAKSPSELASPPSSPTPSPPSSPEPSIRQRRTSSMKPWIPTIPSSRSPGYPPDLPSPPCTPSPSTPPITAFTKPPRSPPPHRPPPYSPWLCRPRRHEYTEILLSPPLTCNRRDAICLSPRTQILADA